MKFAEKNTLIIAYSFDSEDKRLIGSFEYYWVDGTGLAANSTDIQPPKFKAKTIPVFDEENQNWNIVEDNRLETVYSTIDQSESKVEYVGSIKEGFTTLKPQSTFETWTGLKWLDQRTDEEKEVERLKQFADLDRRQFKLMLLSNDLLEKLDESIDSIEDKKLKAKIKIEYGESKSFSRTSESVLFMCNLLNLTSNHVDEIWQQAMTL